MPDKEASEHDQHLRNYLKTGVGRIIGTGRKVFIKLKNGRNIPAFLTVSEQKSKGGSYFIGLLRDLTEIDEAKSKLDAIVRSAPSIILFVDAEKVIRFSNQTSDPVRIPESILGQSVLSFLDNENAKIFCTAFDDSNGTRKPNQFIIRHKATSGEMLIYEGHLSPVFLNEVFDGAVIVANDVTQRMFKHDQVQTLLKQKETLLKEVFHRVKNNFQVIQSLLALHEDTETSDIVKDVIQQIRNRIYALGSVHNLIYEESLKEQLDLRDYLEGLAFQTRISSLDQDTVKILPLSPLASVSVSPNQAIACGAIFNELITNSLKYAKRSPSISMTILYGLTIDDKMLHFWYSDTGGYYEAPLPHCDSTSDQNCCKSEGLGTRLMQNFSEGVNGMLNDCSISDWVEVTGMKTDIDLNSIPKFCKHFAFERIL